ncbi:MAG: hypothetical protein ACFFB2_04335 [Promethearchaeota archaeon]
MKQMDMIQKNKYDISSGMKKGKILFSIVFTFTLPICTLLSPLLAIIFSFLYLPFTLVHELGHLFSISLFLPALSPNLECYFSEGTFCCACVCSHEFPNCWQSIIAMLSGSASVMIFTIFCIITLLRMKSGIFYETGRFYFFFGVLADLPNLFPIFPSSLGFVTDGYAISACLSQMGNPPLISNQLSYFFSLISILIVLTSFFFLGSFLYHLGELLLNEIEEKEMIESI